MPRKRAAFGKRFAPPLSDGQGELWRHEPDRVARVVGGRRRNPETDVCSAVARWAKEHPGLIRLRRTHCGISFRGFAKLWHGPEGWPDYTGGTWFGAALVVEVKREGEEPTADQAETMATLRAWGWIVISCRSLTEFVRELAAECERRGHPFGSAA